MQKFTLIRSYLKDRTIGYLQEIELYSLERPWLDNAPSISCIPEGTYLVQRDKAGKFQWYKVCDVVGRSNIEIHVGNSVKESEGCILLGSSLNAEFNLVHSRSALEKLLKTVGDSSFLLEIRQFDPTKDNAKVFQ